MIGERLMHEDVLKSNMTEFMLKSFQLSLIIHCLPIVRIDVKLAAYALSAYTQSLNLFGNILRQTQAK
jgi:hypothetical protein